jgi:acetyl-CoA carboxylase carboxyl transferase subunit alpha
MTSGKSGIQRGRRFRCSRVVAEPTGGAHHDHAATAANLRDTLLARLAELDQLSTADLLDARYAKFRAFGEWEWMLK